MNSYCLYLTLVRPPLGYATQIWSPQSVELITRVKRMQRRATKYILKLPLSCNVSYTDKLKSLKLLPVTYWLEFLDLVFFFKIIHNLVNVSPSIQPVPRNTRQTRYSNNKVPKYNIPRCKTTTYQKSFTIRTVRI